MHEKPELFCEIVKTLGLVPDIWALYDWSTWLTPIGLKVNNNNNTVFGFPIERETAEWLMLNRMSYLHYC